MAEERVQRRLAAILALKVMTHRLIPTYNDKDPFDGGKTAPGVDAVCSAMPRHRASAGTHPRGRFSPPKAAFFCPLAAFRVACGASPQFSQPPRSASRPGDRPARSGPKSVADATVEANDAAGGCLGATRRAALSRRQGASSRLPDARHRAARLSCPVGGTAPRRPWRL